MKNVKTTILVFGSAVMLLFVLAFSFPQEQKQGEPWDVPEKYENMKNTYADDNSLVSIGKSHYMKHCRSCHGNKGLGDGPKAKMLKTFTGDFSSDEFQAQKDGVLYYQSIIGRDEMPNYESKIGDDEDRWAVVMYLRTL